MKKLNNSLIYFMTLIVFSNVSAQGKIFPCDSTINRTIKLRDAISGQSFAPPGTLQKKDSTFKVYVLCNRSSTEYLLMYKYPGDSKYVFSRFEVGSKRLANFDTRSMTQLGFDHLGTETGVKLGINKDSIVLLKGNHYTQGSEHGMLTLTYRLTDFKADFLRKYNMPGYTEKFFLVNDKLVKFWFGFDNE